MDSPNSESEYSTRGDTSGYTVRVMMPTASIERRLSVKGPVKIYAQIYLQAPAE